MNCHVCENPLDLEEDGKERMVKRRRMCLPCKRERAVEQRRGDPVRYLAFKLYNALRAQQKCLGDGGAPQPVDTLWSREVIQRVYEKCEGKSVISQEGNYKNLCVIFYHPGVFEEWNMVLVSSREAMALKKVKDEGRRQRTLPKEWRQTLNLC